MLTTSNFWAISQKHKVSHLCLYIFSNIPKIVDDLTYGKFFNISSMLLIHWALKEIFKKMCVVFKP